LITLLIRHLNLYLVVASHASISRECHVRLQRITLTVLAFLPRASSGTRPPCVILVERIELRCFLAGCRKKRLDQALCVMSFTLGFFWVFRAVH